MLKFLPSIPSSTSHKIYPSVFFFYSQIKTYIIINFILFPDSLTVYNYMQFIGCSTYTQCNGFKTIPFLKSYLKNYRLTF